MRLLPPRSTLVMHSSAFVVRVPHPQCHTFGVQVVAMRDTLLVWCGAVPPDVEESGQPCAGALSRDWSVAMNGPYGSQATGLYHTAHDMSRTMSQRLGECKKKEQKKKSDLTAKKLGVKQVYLSLDVPDVLASSGPATQAPEDAQAMQALEVGVRRALERVVPYTR